MYSSRKNLEKELLDIHKDLQTTHLKISRLSRLVREKQNDSMEQVLLNVQSEREHAQSVADAFLEDSVEQAYEKVSRILQQSDLAARPWESRAWGRLSLPERENPPKYVRVGELYADGLASQLPVMPAIAPLVQSKHIFVFSKLAVLRKTVSLLNSIAWRIVALSSPDRYQFTVIDSMDRGANFASLLNLPMSIRGSKIYCQEQEIEHVLRSLVVNIEDIIQTRLGDKYETISEYNVANPRTAVPYHFVVFAAYPHGFTDQAVGFLSSIARTGQRAGFYLIGGLLNDVQSPYGVSLRQLIENGTCILVNESGLAEWDDPLFAQVPIMPDSLPSSNLIELLALEIEEALGRTRDIVEFGEFMPDADDWWKGSSVDGLRANIGVDQSGKQLALDIGDDEFGTYHALVGGATGSGKTNFLHELILSLSTTYSPNELELYLIDFKEGIEFQDYATYQLPHIRAVVIEAEREFGLSVLEYLNEEMTRRSNLFKDAGVEVVNIQDYRQRTAGALPRVVVIIDEFVDLFNYDDAILERAYKALDDIARQGRAYGIHIVLAAQRPVTTYQNLQSVKSQIRLRIAFRCNEPDNSALILGEQNEKAAQIDKVGLACVTDNPNSPSHTSEVRIGYVSQDDRILYLEALRSLYLNSKQVFRTPDLVVFSRNEPALWRENPVLDEYLLSTCNRSTHPVFWLGQPVRLAKTVAVRFENRERESMVILGSNQELANSTLVNSVLGLFVTCAPDSSDFLVISSAVGNSSTNAYWRLFKEHAPHSFEQFHHDAIDDVIDELDLRITHRTQAANTFPPVFLVVQGLHRIPKLQSVEEYATTETGERFARILQRGPQVGIHSLVWVDRSDTLRDATGSMNSFDLFSHRVALHMTVDESNSFLGVPDASRLGTTLRRMYYRYEGWEQYAVEKVKPYEVPSAKDVFEVIELVRRKWGDN